MNKKVLKTLEYDKIIDMLVEEADSALGKDSARRLRPSSDHGEIVAMQAETSHALTRLFHHGALSFHGLTDIRPSLVPLAKGGTLGAGELLRIGALLEAAKRAVEFDKKDEETDFLSGVSMDFRHFRKFAGRSAAVSCPRMRSATMQAAN